MSVSSFVAFRYLKASRENRFFSWITALSIAGIAIGVAAMIVVLSIINGFEFELRQRFLAANAHIMATRYPAGMRDWSKWSERIRGDFPQDVVAVAPFVYGETMVEKRGLLQSVLVRGIVPSGRDKVQSLRTLVVPESALSAIEAECADRAAGRPLPAVPSVILGAGVASMLDVKTGDTVAMLVPVQEEIGKLKEFRVVGLYDSGLKHYDNRLIWLSLPSAQDFFRMGELVTGLEVGLAKPEESPRVAAEMADSYNLNIQE